MSGHVRLVHPRHRRPVLLHDHRTCPKVLLLQRRLPQLGNQWYFSILDFSRTIQRPVDENDQWNFNIFRYLNKTVGKCYFFFAYSLLGLVWILIAFRIVVLFFLRIPQADPVVQIVNNFCRQFDVVPNYLLVCGETIYSSNSTRKIAIDDRPKFTISKLWKLLMIYQLLLNFS